MTVPTQGTSDKLEEVKQEIQERFRALVNAVDCTIYKAGNRAGFFNSPKGTLDAILNGKHRQSLSPEQRQEAEDLMQISEEFDRVPQPIEPKFR